MVIGGNGLIILLPILLSLATLAWWILGERSKLKNNLCFLNLLIAAVLLLQFTFKTFIFTGEPLVFTLLGLSFSMLISPVIVFVHCKLQNT